MQQSFKLVLWSKNNNKKHTFWICYAIVRELEYEKVSLCEWKLQSAETLIKLPRRESEKRFAPGKMQCNVNHTAK